ncbi:MAG: hypothetical protein JXR84_21110 [Anaerolineae bacterium]|nr:hypothetical protein [Anaerolineae bacterium]
MNVGWIILGFAGLLVTDCQPGPVPSHPTSTIESEMSPTAIVTVSATAHTPVTPAWNAVKSWAYQLTGYQKGNLDEIATSDYDLIVIDLTRDGSENYFTFAEIRNIPLSTTQNVTEGGMVLPNDNATKGEPWPQTKK